MHWSGRIVLEPFKPPRYLVDNDLSPDIATALGLFSFDIQHVKWIERFKNRSEGVSDPEIIQWCRENARVWITHDIRAKKKHEADLKTNRISVLWLRGHTEQFATWQQFKVLVRIIDMLHQKLLTSHGAIHFQAGIKGGPTPKTLWAENPTDMPRSQNS